MKDKRGTQKKRPVFRNDKMGQKKSKFTFIDLFAGIGGFHLAMESVGGECVFASEIDKFARQTYQKNFERKSPELFRSGLFNEDINKIKPKNIPDFDCLCAGFPCQPFSYAGQKKGFEDKTRGTLFFNIKEILKAKKPRMFFLENVKGLVSHKGGKTVKTILDVLENELDYRVYTKVLSSLDFGLPQKRERWYCVGFRKDLTKNFRFPKLTEKKSTLRDIIDLDNDDPSLKLTPFEMNRIKYHFEHAKEEIRVKHDNSKYKPTTKKGKYGIYSFQKPDGSLRFHVGDAAKTQIQEAFYSCLDTYASTIIANRTPKLWDIGRKLSVREALRLQGFPETFKIPVSDMQAFKQLGNSVSVPVLKAIAEEMVKVLDGEK